MGASCFLILLDAREAIHNPALVMPVNQDAVHPALVLQLLFASLPVQVIGPMTGRAHTAKPLASKWLDFCEPGVELVDVCAVKVKDVPGLALLIRNQRAISNAAFDAFVAISLFGKLCGAIFVEPFGVALPVGYD